MLRLRIIAAVLIISSFMMVSCNTIKIFKLENTTVDHYLKIRGSSFVYYYNDGHFGPVILKGSIRKNKSLMILTYSDGERYKDLLTPRGLEASTDSIKTGLRVIVQEITIQKDTIVGFGQVSFNDSHDYYPLDDKGACSIVKGNIKTITIRDLISYYPYQIKDTLANQIVLFTTQTEGDLIGPSMHKKLSDTLFVDDQKLKSSKGEVYTLVKNHKIRQEILNTIAKSNR